MLAFKFRECSDSGVGTYDKPLSIKEVVNLFKKIGLVNGKVKGGLVGFGQAARVWLDVEIVRLQQAAKGRVADAAESDQLQNARDRLK